jgi:hypothetical protein
MPTTAGAIENANIQAGSLLKENPKRVMIAFLLSQLPVMASHSIESQTVV